jgi:hypothetical protein
MQMAEYVSSVKGQFDVFERQFKSFIRQALAAEPRPAKSRIDP